MRNVVNFTSKLEIDLAQEPDFMLGSLHVRPASCQVESDVITRHLQPKIMQVLVVLAHARGRAISREELLEVCWGNVIVGDDALHRCIAHLRRLAQGDAKHAFTIITQTKVGYRLVENEPTHVTPSVDGGSKIALRQSAHSAHRMSYAAAFAFWLPSTLSALLMVVIALLLVPQQPPSWVSAQTNQIKGSFSNVGERFTNRSLTAFPGNRPPVAAPPTD